jgi:hypothetical protein
MLERARGFVEMGSSTAADGLLHAIQIDPRATAAVLMISPRWLPAHSRRR